MCTSYPAATANHLPSAENARGRRLARVQSVGGSQVFSARQTKKCHIPVRFASGQVEALRINANEKTSSGLCSKTRSWRPLTASHSLAVPSQLAVARCLPSGVKRTVLTQLVCPRRRDLLTCRRHPRWGPLRFRSRQLAVLRPAKMRPSCTPFPVPSRHAPPDGTAATETAM